MKHQFLEDKVVWDAHETLSGQEGSWKPTELAGAEPQEPSERNRSELYQMPQTDPELQHIMGFLV